MAAMAGRATWRSRCSAERILPPGFGIIPQDDVNLLKQLGVSSIYTPKDFDLNCIMTDLVSLIEKTASGEAA